MTVLEARVAANARGREHRRDARKKQIERKQAALEKKQAELAEGDVDAPTRRLV